MREIDRRQFEFFAGDVLPHVELGPVRDRKHAHVFARMDARVVQVPEFRTLRFRIPLTEFVAERKDAFFRARFFFIATCAADAGVELVFGDCFQQRHCLRCVARIGIGIAQAHGAALHRILDVADNQAFAEFSRALVAEGDDFVEVVTGIDVHQREREFARAERLLRQAEHHDGILAAGKKQRRISAFSGDFAHDVDRFRFQPVEMLVAGGIKE
jgi:hypothetical protein